MKAAKGIKEGRKVKQGQIIGYVGSTECQLSTFTLRSNC